MFSQIPFLRSGLLAAAVAGIVATQSAGVAAAVSGRSAHKSVLFIADQHTNAVYALDATNLHAAPLAKINAGINTPNALAVDAHGVLYVSNLVTITEYQPGSLTPFRTLSYRHGGPGALAVGSDGTLAVAEQPQVLADGHLLIYDKGSSMPTRIITIPLDKQDAVFMGGVAIDAAGDVFVSVRRYPGGPAEHLEVAPGSTVGVDTSFPAGNAEGFDAQGNFYIGFGSQINVYAPGSHTPLREITKGVGSPGGVGSAGIFALSPAGALFVPITAHLEGGIGERGDLLGYAPNAQTPNALLRSNIDMDPRAAALRP
jgi:hypothetical protein